MTTALLGIGQMGNGIARTLLSRGHALTEALHLVGGRGIVASAQLFPGPEIRGGAAGLRALDQSETADPADRRALARCGLLDGAGRRASWTAGAGPRNISPLDLA